MKAKPTTKEAFNLIQEGWRAFADMEANGIAIDEKRLKRNMKKTAIQIKTLQEEIKGDDVWKKWSKVYGTEANLGSHVQLGDILFNHFKYDCPEEARTPSGRPKTDEEALSRLDIPFIKKYLHIEKSKKVLNTYLKGIARQTDNGFLHPSFNLHLAVTYRSSCEEPNFQNIPTRIPWIGELIRSVIIAREGFHLVELDYGGIEVKVSTCNHKDPKMVEYVSDPTKDMHRDMASECFLCPTEQVTKELRYLAKNRFVFPQFYGDWYLSCAKNLWEGLSKMNPTLKDGTFALEHLRRKGITRLGRCQPKENPRPGTFEKHVKEVERRFWYERFNAYRLWKEAWWKAYQKRGGFDMVTGFHVEGLYSRNDVINYCIQGPAFHCLLWSLIELNKWLKEHKMKTRIIGQIHDSIVADVAKEELSDYLYMANKIMTRILPRVWSWIIVPLEVEAEVSPIGGSWFDKQKVEL